MAAVQQVKIIRRLISERNPLIMSMCVTQRCSFSDRSLCELYFVNHARGRAQTNKSLLLNRAYWITGSTIQAAACMYQTRHQCELCRLLHVAITTLSFCCLLSMKYKNDNKPQDDTEMLVASCHFTTSALLAVTNQELVETKKKQKKNAESVGKIKVSLSKKIYNHKSLNEPASDVCEH